MTNNNDYYITKYKAINKPEVDGLVLISSVLHQIKNGDKNLPLVQEARKLGKGSAGYDNIKKNKLPTFRFNFIFDKYASNENIIDATGLIYIDVDNTDFIPSNEFVFAKWKSLSNTGYGVLIKVKNLTKDNFVEVYNHLADNIGITADTCARKASQQTVLSFDNDLFHNPSSSIFTYEKIDKVSNDSIIRKEKKGIIGNDTFQLQQKDYRFSNITDYFHDNTDLYIVFKEKEKICSPFIPEKIKEGRRNSTLFFLLSQYALLNPNQGKPFLFSMGQFINSKMYPKLSSSELVSTINKVIVGRNNNSLQIYCNKDRKILFNPHYKITRAQKMKIVNSVLGKLKIEKSKKIIYLAIENWQESTDGKLNQVNVSKKAKLSIATVKRHWYEFKDYVSSLKFDCEQIVSEGY